MLSRNPRQQRISAGKIYEHLLPFKHFQSMKDLNGNVRVSRKASPPYRQIHVNKACMIITLKEFPSSKTSLSLRSQHSNWCACMGNQNENGTCENFTLANRYRSNHELRNGPQSSREALSLSNCLNNGHGLWLFFFLSFLFASGTCQADNNQTVEQCAFGLKTPGRTWPKGDIVLEHGQPLRIYCMLNDTLTDPKFVGKNASDLVFFRNADKLESEYVKVVNATTSMMYVENLPPSKDMYYCKLRLNSNRGNKYEAVCLNNVVVGFKPQKPLAFSCVSQNWDNLTCTWKPKLNHIVTHFSLGFKLHGRAGARQFHSCPKRNPQPPNTCTWAPSTDPIYRQPYEYYTFTLEAENVLGKDNFTYKIHHWAHVIPAKPVALTLAGKTYSSAMLRWEIPHGMRTFPPGLYHRVSYASKYHPENWTSIDVTELPRNATRYFNLTKLEYANTMYDIRVFMKSAKAIDEDSWSKFNNITVKTAATLPGEPPKTTVGSFEIADHSKGRDVYIYWQQIPVYLQNGEHFTYRIVGVEEDGKQSDRQPSEIKDAYAKFKEISFECFKFEIVASNALGDSREKATVYVPRSSDKPPEPVSFTKIAFEGGLYELSWIPMRDQDIVNYTIFWCENERDRPYQCNGYLDWEYVSANVSIHNTTVPDKNKIYQFAIAANTAHASSGMVWASCTAIHNKTIGKMKSVWINSITSDKIQVGWKLECSDRIDIIKGFVIYYCPIVSPYNVTCKNPMMNTTVEGGPHTMNGDLTGLKPYTTYKLTVAVLTKNGEGQYSDPLYNTTLEAAPTPPLHINVTDVTNTTITLEWKPPAAINGVLRYYTVYYNEIVMKVENTTRVQLQCLDPYTDYKISVSAWTGNEGNSSEPIIRKTHIGLPGKPDLPKIRFTNSSQVHISWNPPSNAGGNLDYYEILTADNHIHTNITTCKTECEEYLTIPDCSDVGRGKLYGFSVRAVNFDSNMERYVGPWSDPGEGNCFSSGPSNLTWAVIWIIGCLSGIVFVVFLGYGSNRMWIKCKAMQDVEVKLPPGLQPNVKLLGKGNEQNTQQSSADSSGCSSGQESVTSSLTSESHVSTDSGADLDPVPMSPTKLLESPPSWEASSLRQRCVSGSTKPDSSGDQGRWNPYVKVDKTTDTPSDDTLSLARSTPNLTDGTAAMTVPGLYPPLQQHAWSSTGYVSMPSSEEDSSNDPSPLLQGKRSAQGVYSVVGLPPSPITRPRIGSDARGADLIHPWTADLAPFAAEARKEPATVNPYVSLASLEQNTRSAGGKPQAQTLRDLADMEIVHQVREQQQPPPYSISDKLSKPYVQTGLIGAKQTPLTPSGEHVDPNSQRARHGAPATAGLSGGRPPFAPNFAAPSVTSSQPLIELPPNIYLPVDTAPRIASARINQDNPYVAVSSLVSSPEAPSLGGRRNGVLDNHPASSYPFTTPQLTETTNTKTQRLVDCHDPITRSVTSGPTPLPVVKQTSGYVTIAENPTRSTDDSMLQGSSISYVPHQRVVKKSLSPGYQENHGQADEQYSKVTVVPTTT